MDWKSELESGGGRQRLVNNIVHTMKLQYSALTAEELVKLQTSAVAFEETIFVGATSQSDYFEKISSKMLTEAKKIRDTSVANLLPPNPVVSNPNPPSPAMAESGQADTADWQEEAYQKIKAMKEMYLPDLLEMHHKLSVKFQQHETVARQPKDQMDKLRLMKIYLERIITFLQVSKNNIPLTHRDKLPGYEKQIISFLNSNRTKKPVSANQQILQYGGHPPLFVIPQ
ncbi:hypothetical protein AQUCO_00900093v1 [Aquilegia coerulea]|uniref:Mediator complex subunit 15 KIX domain-containing protein n=1 Tax=Aquilegia coerulea TaxID=218851 RepID=A0A2G5EBY7_AQUCA|nr:hypothetical protein AQUCO_00900093v1 [Aquilegia coerulea]